MPERYLPTAIVEIGAVVEIGAIVENGTFVEIGAIVEFCAIVEIGAIVWCSTTLVSVLPVKACVILLSQLQGTNPVVNITTT